MIADDSCVVQVIIKKTVRDFIVKYVEMYGGTLSSFIRDCVARDVYDLMYVYDSNKEHKE